MPSAMRYGDMRNGKFVMLDNLKYKYDESGNISEMWENGKLAAKYTYDKLNRLVREDNKQLKKTTLFTYDNNGNILSKREFAFTLKSKELLEELESTDILYAYNGDRLLSFGDKQFEHDTLGNPTTYKGIACEWEKGRQLAKYGNIEFKYDGQGRRIKKGDISFIYDSNGNLLKQSDTTNILEFIYDDNGVIGIKHNNATYFYRKNAQGDIIALLDSNGAVVVKYIYDAWGNHNVIATDESYAELSNLNPFRYRGYYYDTETKLYFLKTRYYDPEVGRFTTIDDLSYLDPEHINGLNLYAYCGNNPVANVDPNGRFFFSFLLGLIISSVTIAIVNTTVQFVGDVINYAMTGQWTSSWENYVGAFVGGLFGGATFFLTGGNLIATYGVMNGVETLATGLLTNATGKTSYSLMEIGLKTLVSAGIGVATGYIFGGTKISGITLGKNSYLSVWKSVLTRLMHGTASRMSFKVILKGLIGFAMLKSGGAAFGGLLSSLADWFKKKFGDMEITIYG